MKNTRWKIYFLAIVLSSCAPMTSSPTSIDVTHSADANSLLSTETITATFTPVPTFFYRVTPAKTSFVLGTGLPPTATVTPNPTQAREQEKIQEIIQRYFDLRYSLFSMSPPGKIEPEIFGEFVLKGDEAKDFLMTETAKMAVERKWYELRELRYAKYEYTLKYTNSTIDTTSQTATVSLSEYFEIICERAMKNNPENPSPCAIGELAHKIILGKENGEWKIISDIYRDSWWRQFRKPGMTTDEILQGIEVEMEKLEGTPSP